MWRPSQRNEQLARARVTAGQRDADTAGFERLGPELAAQRRQVWAAEAVAVGIAELNDEARQHPVYELPVVETGSCQVHQSFDGEGALLASQRDREATHVGFELQPHL